MDVGHSWDLKGLTVQGDFTINHYHPIFNSVFKMLPSLNVMVVIVMVGITLMLFFISCSCPFKEEEARKKSRCRYIIFAG